MPRYSQERIEYYIERIRRIIVLKPEATIFEIQETLEKSPKEPIHLDKDFINKLLNKIRKERNYRLNQVTINVVLAKFEDEVEELKKRLWLVIQDPTTTKRDKISAIRELRNSSKDLFDKMFDAGVFERQLGKVKAEGTLTPEQKEMVSKALDYVHELGQTKGADSQ